MKLEKEKNIRIQEVEKTMNASIAKVAKAEKFDYVLEVEDCKIRWN